MKTGEKKMNNKIQEVMDCINNFLEDGNLVDFNFEITSDKPVSMYPSPFCKQYKTDYLTITLKVIREY